jgi:hypothetical protein
MSGWSELLSAALLGTSRAPDQGDDAAADLLDRAAAWAGYRRAGAVLATGSQPPAAAEAESLPVVAAAAAGRLALLLEESGSGATRFLDAATRESMVDEWLATARARGRLVPPELLPALLDYGLPRRDLREAIAAAGGVRAQWLAQHNPQWTYLGGIADGSTVDNPELWATGTHAQRLGYLATARRTGPALARALLEAEWPALTAEERPGLLAILREGLGPDDEALLERALDDRRREVRLEAQRLLAGLDSSAYNARAAARALAVLAPVGASLTVTPPAECDKAMRRDGIAPKPPTGMGERAWWLEEVLANAPLWTWPSPSPEELLGRSVDEDWAATVYRGLARAAATRRDPDWAAATLDRLGDAPRDRELRAALYPVLAPANLVDRATRALAGGAAAEWGLLLSHCPTPWPPELARAVLSGVWTLAQQPKLSGELYHLCRLAALRLPVGTAGEARALAERAAADPTARTTALESLADVLSLRLDLNREIS